MSRSLLHLPLLAALALLSAQPEERDYDMWEDGVGSSAPEEEAADEIPEGNVTKTLKPKSEAPVLEPPPEFDADAVKDPAFVGKDAPPPNWEEVSPEEMGQLKEGGKDPLKADPPPPPPPSCEKELTLECFIAELNTKITSYDAGKLGHTGCNRVEASMLTGGIKAAYRLDFTGESGCRAELLAPIPEPVSEALKAKQAEQLEKIRVAVESFCSTWRVFAFDAYIRIPAEGDVRLVETSNSYYRISWEDIPPSPVGPMPAKYSEFMEWKKKKEEWDRNRPMGKEVYILLKTDRSEIKRIEREPPTRKLPDPPLRTLEHYKFALKRGFSLLSYYRYLRPDHRATAHIQYSRSGEYFMPSSVRVDYFPSDGPGYFVEANLSGCGFNRTPRRDSLATPPSSG